MQKLNIFTICFMCLCFILPSIVQAQDPTPVPDRVLAQLERQALQYEKKNYFFASIERVDRTVISTWLTDKNPAAAMDRIEALREAWAIVQAPNYENFAVYSTAAIGGDTELGIYPIGKKDSFSSAEALMAEMEANPVIMAEFDLELAHTNAFGGSLPINHGVVQMYPKDDEGPAFLADRYLYDTMAIVKDQWTLTYANPLIKPFTGWLPVDNFQIEEIEPTELFNEWAGIVNPAPEVGENCLLQDPEGFACSMPKGDGGETVYTVLPGLMADLEAAQAALDAQVYSVQDGHPCGGVSSATYVLNACGRNMGECWVTMQDAMGCADTFDYGIDYVSRCVASPDYSVLTVYIIGYHSQDTGLICSN